MPKLRFNLRAILARMMTCRRLRDMQAERLAGRQYAADRLLMEGEGAVSPLLQEAQLTGTRFYFDMGIRDALHKFHMQAAKKPYAGAPLVIRPGTRVFKDGGQ